MVEPARRAAEATPRRPYVAPRATETPRALEPARDAFEEPRPRFANDIEPEPRRGGFSLFGWKKPEAREVEATPRTIDLDEAPARVLEPEAHDPALDEELEIPAFLRRQINPR